MDRLVGFSVDQQTDPIGLIGIGDPHFGPVDDQVITNSLGTCFDTANGGEEEAILVWGANRMKWGYLDTSL